MALLLDLCFMRFRYQVLQAGLTVLVSFVTNLTELLLLMVQNRSKDWLLLRLQTSVIDEFSLLAICIYSGRLSAIRRLGCAASVLDDLRYRCEGPRGTLESASHPCTGLMLLN